MLNLKNIFDFYIKGSLHVATAVFAFIQISYIQLNISYDEHVGNFGFFGTIAGYNFIKYHAIARSKKTNPSKTVIAFIILSVLAGLACAYFYLQLNKKTQLMAFAILLLTILYALPVYPNKSNLRNWSGIKIYLVAFAWVSVTVLIPVINAEENFSIIVILKCLQRFMVVLILMFIFEIIDLQFDEKTLRTIPQKLGIKKTKLINYLMILAFLTFEILKPSCTINQFFLASLVALMLVMFTYFASSRSNSYYTSFWVESVPIVWLILVLILK